MAKAKIRYVCTSCGSVSSRWLGRCPQCGEWNTMAEETVTPEAPKAAQSMARSGPSSQATSLSDIALEDMTRVETGIGELDRVLGGGIVPGALILLSGDPESVNRRWSFSWQPPSAPRMAPSFTARAKNRPARLSCGPSA